MSAPDVLAATVGGVPVEGSALALLGFVIFWFTRRADKTDNERNEQIKRAEMERAALEAKVDTLHAEVGEQRQEKHKALNRVAFLQGRARLTAESAKSCTCGAMASLLPLFEMEDP